MPPLPQPIDIDHLPPGAVTPPTAVTIGNFDGCHLGHQRLISAVRVEAERAAAQSVALTFDPRPDAFFSGVAKETLLFTPAQKARALAELGIERHLVQRFDERFSTLSHDEYYGVLRRDLGAAAVVVGYDFHFGHKRRGDTAYLIERGRADGMRVQIGEAVLFEAEAISSTRLRHSLVETGAVEAAAAMLGRPYCLEGEVRRGDQLGRQLGVPTTNLEGIDQLVPRFGIYAGYVWLAPREEPDAPPPIMRVPAAAIPAVFSIGIRPTLDNPQPPVRIEAHLLAGRYGPNEHYGLRTGYYLTHRLRDELRFDSLEDLKAQMARDIARARDLTASTPSPR
jgi:riboflavin kinase/FMN adenylyltransferase